ncbi:gag-pol polyprotein [Tanacetum coccineum]
MKDMVMPNNSQVKFKKTEVEDHHRISSNSNKTKSVTACNDSLKSRTSNVNAVCATCGKCLFNLDHYACVSKFLNDVNARYLEVAFQKSTCFVRDLQGNDLLTVSKAQRSSFKPKVVPSSKRRLNLLHMDLCGPMRVASINGKKYILFLNKTLNAFFKEEGIQHQTSTPRTHEQNDVVERRNRTLVEAARTMLSASKLPLFNEIKEMSETTVDNNTSGLAPQLPNVSPSAHTSAPLQQELNLLFGPLYDEFFNEEPKTLANVNAEENNTDNQAEIQVDNAHVDDNEFYNVFSTSVREEAESSSRYVDLSNMHTFYQPHQSEHRWTKDHPLTQVCGNLSKPVQTR